MWLPEFNRMDRHTSYIMLKFRILLVVGLPHSMDRNRLKVYVATTQQ